MKHALATEPILSLDGLTLAAARVGNIVADVRLGIAPGQIFALVGESGSGKSIGHVAGTITFRGEDLFALSDERMRAIRGRHVGMIFQEPMVSLNPAMTVGRQMMEGLKLHYKLSHAEARQRCLDMLARIRIDDPERCFEAYPHEYSGGMRQRIMIASVMLLRPALLIADEPTTALDTLVQKDVLDLMVELCRDAGTSVLLISHDLALVSRYADELAVMQNGRIVETGAPQAVLKTPRHDYTRRLIASLPKRSDREVLSRDKGPFFDIRNLTVDFAGRQRLFRSATRAKRAVSGVSLTINRGEILALVGTSGSGKTTLGRAIAGLVKPTSGDISFRGVKLADAPADLRRDYRLNCQVIFQDPFSSLDPRMRVEAILAEPLKVIGIAAAERHARVAQMLTDIGLDDGFARRLPHELSGGQRQRIAIGRAIIRRPALVIADEPISALDMTVQKQILDLLRRLQRTYEFACLLISHDLAAVASIAERVLVMNAGQIVEEGPLEQVFDNPQHPFTRKLLAASPAAELAAEAKPDSLTDPRSRTSWPAPYIASR
jgi:peptide/nickel transport system ATP-binding protein